MHAFLGRDIVRASSLIYSSPEHKALCTAEGAADIADAPLHVTEALQEVDWIGEGFVRDTGAYVEMAERYFANPQMAFDGENRLDVERRITGFVNDMETECDPVLIISHGMLLTTMLAPLFGQDRFEFWKQLAFGEVIQVEYSSLNSYW